MNANVQYDKFIRTLLKRANITKEFRREFTDPDAMIMWDLVRTHPSCHPKNNYEELEFLGDGFIKAILNKYILKRFAGNADSGGSDAVVDNHFSTNEGTFSKLRRFIEKEKPLANFADQLGFWKYVKADEETLNKHKQSTLSDVFEAFIGALASLIDERVRQGLGFRYSYVFMAKLLDGMPLEPTEDVLDDPVTRLNELYKSSNLANGVALKWGDAKYFSMLLFLPKMTNTATTGDLAYNEENRGTMMYDGQRWISTLSLCDSNVEPLVHKYTMKNDEYQQIWYSCVYGFPADTCYASKYEQLQQLQTEINDCIKTKDIALIDKNVKLMQRILDTKGRIIGHGFHYTMACAKKICAQNALNYLSSLGYKKQQPQNAQSQSVVKRPLHQHPQQYQNNPYKRPHNNTQQQQRPYQHQHHQQQQRPQQHNNNINNKLSQNTQPPYLHQSPNINTPQQPRNTTLQQQQRQPNMQRSQV